MSWAIGVDEGGTHVDIVTTDGQGIKAAKVPNTAEAVFEGLEIIAADYGVSIHELLTNCQRFVYGSTIATNMFVSRTLPKVGVLTTMGHRDSLWLRDGYKPNRWNIRMSPLWSIAPRYLRRTVVERLNYKGEVLTPLDEQSVRQAVRILRDEGIEVLAICFLWSFLNPAHEQRAKAIAEEELPGIPVVISYDVLPTIREWERTYCTILSAAIVKETGIALQGLRRRLMEAGLQREPLVMQCNGGLATIDMIVKTPIFLIASGAAGGALAGRQYYDHVSKKGEGVITIDIGGTSCDVCVMPHGEVPLTKNKRLEEEPIAVPSVDIHTVGAGGGSIAWIDAGGALRVGPHSAGARPGPACYGKGGDEPTVTDAYLVLGYLNSDFFLGGKFKLYPALAEKAIREKIAKPLNCDVVAAAWRIFAISNSQIVDAMRLVSIQRGIDPEPYTLVVGGGAGPLLAGKLAEAIGIRRVLIPREAGGLCALGLMAADVVLDSVRAYAVAASEIDLERWSMLFKELEASNVEWLQAQGIPRARMSLKRFVDVRYVGQIFELEVEVPVVEKFELADLTRVVADFEALHDRLYHYRLEGSPVEFMTSRSRVTSEQARTAFAEMPFAGADPAGACKGERPIYHPETASFGQVDIYDGEQLKYGNVIEGIAIVETAGTTIGVWRNQRLVVNKYGDFELEVPKS